MLNNLILFGCVVVLTATTMFLANVANNFKETSAYVHCMNHQDFDVCKEKFFNDIYVHMKQGR